MADPKYAKLPGLDLDAPDVYETSDLPESDQIEADQVDDGNECVEKLSVDTNDAFKKFKGKKIDTGDIDFSDRVSHSRRTGYHIPRSEYEILGEPREAETAQQKYQRLQHEIRELAEDVTKVKESVQSDSVDQSSPVQLSKQVEYLQSQLTDLHLDKLIGPDAGPLNLADPHAALQKRLITALESYQPSSDEKAKKASGTEGGDGDHVTYQLYYRPESAKFSNNARMADLEQRLERIEAVIGSNPEKLSTLTSDTNNKSVIGAIATLSGKLKLLDASQLEQVEGRMYALSQKITQIAEKKDSIESTEKSSKVAELYEIAKKWDAVVDTLPHVVDRLTALKELHEQALQFSQALTHLDTAQQQLTAHLTAHGDMNKQVEKTLAENMTVIKADISSLDQRVKDLK